MAEFKKAAATGRSDCGYRDEKILKKGSPRSREFDGADSEKGLAAQRTRWQDLQAADRNWNISKTGLCEA